MTAKKLLIPLELPNRFGGGTRNQFNKFIDEAKLRTVRQGGKRLN